MVFDQFTRGLGFGKPDNLATRLEMDKQSWQNVNRIRVAGVGDTNYVVVKDDIGNWYIKGYSGDPERVFKAAKNVLLYSASGAMGTNLISYDIDLHEHRDRGGDEPKLRGRSRQQKQLNDFQKRYQRQLEQDLGLLRNSAISLSNRVRQSWSTNAFTKDYYESDLEIILQGPEKRLKEDIPALSDEDGIKAAVNKTIKTVETVRKYHNEVSADLVKVQIAPDHDLSEAQLKVKEQEDRIRDMKSRHEELTTQRNDLRQQASAETDLEAKSALAEGDERLSQRIKALESSFTEAEMELMKRKTKREEEKQEVSDANRAKLTARRILSTEVREILIPFIERRKAAARDQATALTVISTSDSE
jgi:hypothetical protein